MSPQTKSKSQTMNDAKLYAMTGLFDTPDEIMHAAAEATKRYRKFDVHTPYPVHGMDDAMGLPESPIGWLTICIGTTCMLLMLSFISWISLIDYPNVWAGKPWWNILAYVPILFETTILTGAVLTVIIMFTIVFGLPRNNHPLHDTPYMQRTSDDKFGLCIEATDDAFGEDSSRAFLESIGAKTILPIHYDQAEADSGLRLTSPIFLIFIALVIVGGAGTSYFLLNRMVFLPPYNWMSVQDKYSAQSANNFFKDGRTMQVPVQGTIPRDYLPEPDADKPDDMGKYDVNPLPRTAEVFATGKLQFDSKCSVCHGYYGEGGNGPNGSRLPSDAFPAGKSLHSKTVQDWSDGRIYHVITFGQNVMPSYAKQLTKEERWAVVHYIRALQRSLNPKENDNK